MSHSCRCCKEESDVKDDLEIVEAWQFAYLISWILVHVSFLV